MSENNGDQTNNGIQGMSFRSPFISLKLVLDLHSLHISVALR